MTDTAQSASIERGGLIGVVKQTLALLEAIPHHLLALFARFGVAGVFWFSARTKVAGCDFSFDRCQITSSTYFLFKTEFKVPLLPYELAAQLATVAEHIFPILLFIGLASRFSAAGLLFMTFIIQFFVYPSAWPTHTVWAASLLYVLARGPGAFSLDHFIARKFLH